MQLPNGAMVSQKLHSLALLASEKENSWYKAFSDMHSSLSKFENSPVCQG